MTLPMKKKKRAFDALPKKPRAILVGIVPLRYREKESPLEELRQLAATAGIVVVEEVVQALQKPYARTFLGKGKIEEIGALIKEHKIDRVVADDALSPLQAKSLEDAWCCEVWDRSRLILSVFAMHARTAQAKAQVELANYEHLMSRLRGRWIHHSRQEGKLGARGPGEKELETDKRIVRQRILTMKRKLVRIEKIARSKRKQRSKKVCVALVGYTNAGKSTLMQALSKRPVTVEDKLFSTLSTTISSVVLEGTSFLLSDTVGFIRKLPHGLIASFRSTLAEVAEADILLHVVDFSNPHYQQQIDVVLKILREIGAASLPMILLLNKQDKVEVEDSVGQQVKHPALFFEQERHRLAMRYQCPVLYCSAAQGDNVEKLKHLLKREVAAQYKARLTKGLPDGQRAS